MVEEVKAARTLVVSLEAEITALEERLNGEKQQSALLGQKIQQLEIAQASLQSALTLKDQAEANLQKQIQERDKRIIAMERAAKRRKVFGLVVVGVVIGVVAATAR